MKTKKINVIVILCVLLSGLTGPSCKDYLDVVPDNIPTVDHAFNKRHQAEGFLYGCYSFLPNHAGPEDNPAFLAGDEAWLFDLIEDFDPRMWQIAKGNQGTNAPIANWYGSVQEGGELNGGKPLFTAIRDCNIFIENIHKPIDMEDWERELWTTEAKFLKAYYHFWLLRMYGPIPIIDENTPIYEKGDEVQMYREPVDSVCNYIANTLDETIEYLPLKIEQVTIDQGRITQPIALALKAQVLTYAASPLFNGNTDYADMVDNRGIALFQQDYDAEKWRIAADALKEAIDVSHEAGHELYDFTSSGITSNLDEKTIKAMQVRGAVTERWNNEIIWGDSNSNTNRIQQFSFPAFTSHHSQGHLILSYAPTLRVVEQFYTENGVPVEEDKDWVDVDLFELKEGNEAHKYYIKEGFETINLHFNREARFYGSISFDGGTFFGNGRTDDSNLQTTIFKYGLVGQTRYDKHSETGYLVKKVIHRLTSISDNSDTPSYYRYAFPVIRLADLYLMYAEALNEYKEAPDAEVYEYIDLVRNRTGLDGVVESWGNHSIDPEKPSTKEGMREIIHRERMNELAFEGARFWDLRRWKLSEEYMNRAIRGLDYLKDDNDFYNIREIDNPVFEKKDYLWPLKQSVLTKNSNLIQNSGW